MQTKQGRGNRKCTLGRKKHFSILFHPFGEPFFPTFPTFISRRLSFLLRPRIQHLIQRMNNTIPRRQIVTGDPTTLSHDVNVSHTREWHLWRRLDDMDVNFVSLQRGRERELKVELYTLR